MDKIRARHRCGLEEEGRLPERGVVVRKPHGHRLVKREPVRCERHKVARKHLLARREPGAHLVVLHEPHPNLDAVREGVRVDGSRRNHELHRHAPERGRRRIKHELLARGDQLKLQRAREEIHAPLLRSAHAFAVIHADDEAVCGDVGEEQRGGLLVGAFDAVARAHRPFGAGERAREYGIVEVRRRRRRGRRRRWWRTQSNFQMDVLHGWLNVSVLCAREREEHVVIARVRELKLKLVKRLLVRHAFNRPDDGEPLWIALARLVKRGVELDERHELRAVERDILSRVARREPAALHLPRGFNDGVVHHIILGRLDRDVEARGGEIAVGKVLRAKPASLGVPTPKDWVVDVGRGCLSDENLCLAVECTEVFRHHRNEVEFVKFEIVEFERAENLLRRHLFRVDKRSSRVWCGIEQTETVPHLLKTQLQLHRVSGPPVLHQNRPVVECPVHIRAFVELERHLEVVCANVRRPRLECPHGRGDVRRRRRRRRRR
mmetsp:Transcript_19600/g.63633  ORF Transcript_19600/g.63633 Transcript_19600/m.63633 type:complete len:492 (+) Transcript_19600:3313-4788(+)